MSSDEVVFHLIDCSLLVGADLFFRRSMDQDQVDESLLQTLKVHAADSQLSVVPVLLLLPREVPALLAVEEIMSTYQSAICEQQLRNVCYKAS